MARLELCCNWRIFQEKSVPEILQALLKEHRVLDYEQRIYHEHLPREYCVQAGDSDHYLHDRLGERVARSGTRFWVVRPALGLLRTENLGTLVSGPYIEALPSSTPGERQARFQTLAEAPNLLGREN